MEPMITGSLPKAVVWRKSSRSSDNGGQCVEVGAYTCHDLRVRDSKHVVGPSISADRAEWNSFLSAVKGGYFDC